MAHVEDRWHLKDKKTRSGDYGRGLRYRAVWDDGEGRRRKSFRTKDAATAYLASQVTDMNRGDYVAPNLAATTLADLWPRFKRLKSTKAKSTRDGYQYAWEGYIRDKWGMTQIRDLKGKQVEEWIAGLKTKNEKPISASWQHKILLTMKGLCELAIDDKIMVRNPLKRARPAAQPQAERRYLDVAQADALAEAIKPHDTFLWVMLMTGMRRGEAAGLKVSDFDARRKRLRIHRDIDVDGLEDATKSGRHRDAPVHGELLKMVKAAAKGKDRPDYLFPSPSGKPWTRDSWRSRWEKARVVTGIHDLDTHELRHTAVSWAIQSGANVKAVQRMVGHASASITLDVYGHLWDDELDLVAQRMGDLLATERAAKNVDVEAAAPAQPPSTV